MPSLPAPCPPRLASIAVCGLGLIGGSVVRRLRASSFRGRISGVDIDGPLLGRLLAERWIDDAAALDDRLFASHDLVVFCQPVGALLDCIETHAAGIAAGRAVCVDAASVKSPVARALARHGVQARFVPSHPIAGKASHGWDASEEGLFHGKRCVVAPAEGCDADAVACAEAFWRCMGADIDRMPPDLHDAVYAALSHLPQVLSYAYLHSLALRPESRGWIGYQGTGFRGFTRLGGSDPALWADIALQNRPPLLEEIDRLGQSLAWMRDQLVRGDAAALARAFELARSFHARSQPS